MNTQNSTRQIQIENVGPVERLSIPLPEAGVIVLRGRNGIGKSHALAAIDTLVSGRGRPPCRDGSPKAVVEGFGAKITIGRSLRRTGEAEVVSLEGRLDITQLVQPPIKDEEAADRVRIKALIQLSGRPADAAAFASVLPDGLHLGELVSPAEHDDDPIIMAARIKRALEAEARRHEKIAEEAKAEYSVLEQEVGKAPTDDPLWRRVVHQPDVIRAEAERDAAEACAAVREIEARREMARRQAEQIAQAKKALEQLTGADGETPEALDVELTDIEANIRRLEHDLAAARERRTQIHRRREDALRRRDRIASLQRIIEQPIATVFDEDVLGAKRRYESANRRLTQTIELLRLARTAQRMESIRATRDEAEAKAETLRDAAQATDDVLSSMVAAVTKQLRVESGRLVCDTSRGITPFGELSPGERWRMALEIAVEQLGPGGLVTVPQEAWESLDPVNRDEIANIAKQIGVVLITAEAGPEPEIAIENV